MKRKTKYVLEILAGHKQNRFLLFFILLSAFTLANANSNLAFQKTTISGTVTDALTGEVLPGVNVFIKGTTTGIVTDVNGKYSLAVEKGQVIVFSFISYMQEEVEIGDQTVLDMTLSLDVTQLDEIIVIGYGVQKKKLSTGATSHVKSDDIQKMNSVSALGALQGQTPGVHISSTSGQPGEGFNVSIRGIGTVGDYQPLYIVDGIQVENIDYLNSADIESVDVLKDAASAAIYGNRAANGVVLITTKQGKKGTAMVSYDGYYGFQNVTKKLDLLNAKQYSVIMNEMRRNAGNSSYNYDEDFGINIDAIGEGTNWMDAIFESNVPTQNHVLNAYGGSEKSTYSLSLSYTDQAGIVGGEDLSSYKRYNFRINTENEINKYFKIGEHLTFTRTRKNGVGVGDRYDNGLNSIFNASPFRPIYDEEGNYFNAAIKDTANNFLYLWNPEETNPIGLLNTTNKQVDFENFVVGDVFAELQPLPGLKIRTSFGIHGKFGSNNKFLPEYRFSTTSFNPSAYYEQKQWNSISWKWENTVNYDFSIDKHKFSTLAGISAQATNGSEIRGKNSGLIFDDYEHAWLDNAKNMSNWSTIELEGKPYEKASLASYFGRVLYDYNETYMLNATLRVDGSSKFAEGNRWGWFPSASAGWVLSNEDFLSSVSTLDFLKLRASWGQNGNERIESFAYVATIKSDEYYFFGNDQPYLGSYQGALSNKEIEWETSEQLDVGLDMRLFYKLNINIDVYQKITKNWLVEAPVMATAGADAPFVNGGDIENKGVELAIAFNDKAGDFDYYINGNIAYNKNKVTRIDNAEKIIHGEENSIWHGISEIYRAEVEYPIGYFWGFETNGIFQKPQDVLDYKNEDQELYQPDAVPGDVIFVDYDKDGDIDEDDKHEIGNPHPDFIFGLNTGFTYKGFDFTITSNGVLGNEIVKGFRDMSRAKNNWTTEAMDRWYGPNTSNRFPRVVEKSQDDNKNWDRFSDLYIENGSYWRISNITLGYDFSNLAKKAVNFSELRLYASVQNLLTITGYSGMDPEVGYANDDWSSGIDIGFYPHPRIIMFGANIKF